MKKLWLVVGLIIFVSALFFVISKNMNETDFSAQVAGASTEKSTDLIGVINALREENNLPKLSLNEELNIIAQTRTDDMITRQYYSHTNPDGISYNAYFQGYKGYSCENLNLLEEKEPAVIVESWTNSESHRKCLLADRLAFAGYSIKKMDDTRYLTALILTEN